jgi:AraC family transcriptional regulator
MMDWLERMNEAITYIEDHLTGEIDFDKVARTACCSSYHFQRMFSFITGVPLSEYIRRRRLTLAAFELQTGGARVIELAGKYGYDSPNSFTRAFEKLHGISPSSARSAGTRLKAFPRLSFHISIKGDMEMDYRIEQRPAFSVFGKSITVSVVDGECYRQIPEFWLKCVEDGTMERILKAASGGETATLRGEIFGNDKMLLNAVMFGHESQTGTFKYMVCQNVPQSGVPDGFETLRVPPLTWAVFPTERHPADQTTGKIQAIWQRVYPEWFPTSGYEHADGPDFELYHHAGDGQFIAEVWVPVQKAAKP